MKLVVPSYYDSFRCIGGKCQNNCCIGWEIDIDEATLLKYETLGEDIGEKVRKSIVKSGEVSHFCLTDGERCPHLNRDNLCEIIIEAGEECLCEICREHPRYYLTLGERVYGGIGLSCETAAELILGEKTQHGYSEWEVTDFEPEECDEELHSLVLSYREKLCECIMNGESAVEVFGSVTELTAELQGLIDGEKYILDPVTCPKNEDIKAEIAKIFSSFEYMDSEISERIGDALGDPCAKIKIDPSLLRSFKNILMYFTDRYLPYAVCDGDAVGAMWVGAVSSLVIMAICHNEKLSYDETVRLAARYSGEIDYSEDNVSTLKSCAAYGLLYAARNLFDGEA